MLNLRLAFPGALIDVNPVPAWSRESRAATWSSTPTPGTAC